MKLLRWEAAAILCALVGAGTGTTPAAAQDQSQKKESVAEAARRAREEREKKKAVAQPARTFDNDNLPAPKEGEAINQIGPNAPAPGSTSPQETPASAEDTQAKEQERQKVADQLKDAKAQLDDTKKDLEIAKRAFDLDRDTYYSDPNFRSNKAGKTHLDDEQAGIAAKQQAVDKIQKKIRDLEDKLKALGGASEQKQAPSSPQ